MNYFPIKIKITEKGHKDYGEVKVITDPSKLPNGVSFIVLETRAEI